MQLRSLIAAIPKVYLGKSGGANAYFFLWKDFHNGIGGTEKESDEMTGVESTGNATDVSPDAIEVSDSETKAALNITASPDFFDCAHASSQASPSGQLSQLRCEL